MNETSKCHNKRTANGDFDKYLRGYILDIGCGDDPLRPTDGTVRSWDMPDGDAEFLATIPDETFDCVYSSHCLEHLRSVPRGLANWVRVLKSGGFLYMVIPDFDLYEHGHFPSWYNPTHLNTFSITHTRKELGRANHYNTSEDVAPLLASLGMEMLRCELEDDGYDYTAVEWDQTLGVAMAQICTVWRKN